MTKNLTEQLLESWEETYKKGQLTFWIFLALRDGNKYVDEIKTFVEKMSRQTITCEEQSLYRALRKYDHIEVVGFEMQKGNKGPDRKYYYLTPLGNELFRAFVERNIMLFHSPEITKLLKTE